MALQNQPVPSPLPAHAQNDKTSASQINGVIFPSASRTNATYTSESMYNAHARGVRLHINVTSDGAAGTVTTEIQVKDPVSDNWKRITGAVTAALTDVTGQPSCLTVYPGITVLANVDIANVLGCEWRVVTVVAANAVTFSIGAEYLI